MINQRKLLILIEMIERYEEVFPFESEIFHVEIGDKSYTIDDVNSWYLGGRNDGYNTWLSDTAVMVICNEMYKKLKFDGISTQNT